MARVQLQVSVISGLTTSCIFSGNPLLKELQHMKYCTAVVLTEAERCLRLTHSYGVPLSVLLGHPLTTVTSGLWTRRDSIYRVI